MDYIYLLEFDRAVVSYQEQPCKIYYIRDGRSRRYTPDFYVERKHVRQIVEVKPETKASTEENLILFRIAFKVCRKNGYDFLTVTDTQIRIQPKLRNIKLLYKYARTPVYPQHQISCQELFAKADEVILSEVLIFFAAKGVGAQVVFALIYWGVLTVDLMQPLSPNSVVSLPKQSSVTKKES